MERTPCEKIEDSSLDERLPLIFLPVDKPSIPNLFAVTLVLAQAGLMGGWSSPYIAQLTSPESLLSITMEEGSWVVSLFNFGRLIGAIGGAICVNYLGRKMTILITSGFQSLYWLMIVVANSVEWLYIARLFGGVGLGMIYSSFAIYIGEIAGPSIRGALVALGITGIPIGLFLMSVMGAYLSVKVSAAICLVPCTIQIILFTWLPESPHYLIKNNKEEKVKASIRWYNRSCDVETEFSALKKFVDNSQRSFVECLNEFRTPVYRKSLFICLILFAYSQLSGINNIMFYMETILTTAQVSFIDPPIVVIIVITFGIVGSILSTFLMDRFGRKILMISSCLGVTVSLCILTLQFYLLDSGFDPKAIEGLSIVAMLLFHLSVFIGLLSVPAAVLSEIFPPHLKCIAACFSGAMAAIFAFASTATYLPLLKLMTEQYMFLFYALLVFVGVPFTMFYVPETKGMTLQEIQSQLMR